MPKGKNKPLPRILYSMKISFTNEENNEDIFRLTKSEKIHCRPTV